MKRKADRLGTKANVNFQPFSNLIANFQWLSQLLMLNQSNFHTMKFNLGDYDLDLGRGDFNLDFNLGDFDLIPACYLTPFLNYLKNRSFSFWEQMFVAFLECFPMFSNIDVKYHFEARETLFMIQ